MIKGSRLRTTQPARHPELGGPIPAMRPRYYLYPGHVGFEMPVWAGRNGTTQHMAPRKTPVTWVDRQAVVEAEARRESRRKRDARNRRAGHPMIFGAAPTS